MEDQEVIREFLLESNENLNRLDQELVDLEKRPKDKDLLGSVFRTIHTIKGTSGFLGFRTLESLTHQAENILSQLRAGQREVTSPLMTLILDTVDAIRTILVSIETSGTEGVAEFEGLSRRLSGAQTGDAPSHVPAETSLKDLTADLGVPEAERASSVSETAIRVDVALLDKLMNLVGELVLARNQILQFNAQKEDAVLNATSQRLNLITSELQENVMKTRMQPIGLVWNKLPRLIRDIAHSCGKQISLAMDGAGTELDKTIIEAIKDPLTHLVRNCGDHGIESPDVRARLGKPPRGTVSLKAYHEGGQVNIEISDDGAGMDVEQLKQKAIEKGLLRPEQAERISARDALHLIFVPGFSTAKTVTNVSGRGVGMDVVRSNIERIGGVVDVSSQVGAGTTIRLKIPLTLAIIPGLIVTSGGERFLIPQVSLLELIRIDGDANGKIEHVHGTPVYRRRGCLLPLAFLHEVLGLESGARGEALNIVVLQAEDRQFGLVVDGINDTQEIVVKPLGRQFKGLSVYAGATIMGDGRIALILDVLGIGHQSGVLAERRDQTRAEAQRTAQSDGERQRLLIFHAGSFERLAAPLSLVARLEKFPQSMLERAGGRSVVQYRGGILPLVSLSSILEPEAPDTASRQDPVEAIVFSEGQRRLGIIVDRIVDIVEEAVETRRHGGRRGLIGSAVVGKQVADFLDVRAILEAAGSDWLAQKPVRSDATRVLLAEASPFTRGLLRGELEMAGYRILEAADSTEALGRLERHEADLLLADLDLPPAGARGLRESMRRDPDLARIPAIAIGEADESASLPAGEFDDCQLGFDREAMLRSIERLARLAGAAPPEPAIARQER